MQAFLESDSFEDAIRNAVSIGGDSDTIAAITGSIAEAFYGMTEGEVSVGFPIPKIRLSVRSCQFSIFSPPKIR